MRSRTHTHWGQKGIIVVVWNCHSKWHFRHQNPYDQLNDERLNQIHNDDRLGLSLLPLNLKGQRYYQTQCFLRQQIYPSFGVLLCEKYNKFCFNIKLLYKLMFSLMRPTTQKLYIICYGPKKLYMYIKKVFLCI